MMLNSAIDKYVEYRRSLGESFKTNANLLKQFCNYPGKDMNLLEITASITSDFCNQEATRLLESGLRVTLLCPASSGGACHEGMYQKYP